MNQILSESNSQNDESGRFTPSETQSQTSFLTENNNPKLAKKTAILILLGIVGIGGYYIYIKNNAFPIDDQTPLVDKALDGDSDGLPDYMEEILGTDSNKADTDGDGYSDFDEIKNGYNPLTSEKFTKEERDNAKAKILEKDIYLYEELFKNPEKPGWINYQSDDFWFEIYYPKDWEKNYPPDSANYTYMEFRNPKTSEEKVSLTYYKNDDAFRAEHGVFLETYYNKAPIVEKRGMVSFGANQFQKLAVRDCPRAGAICAKYFFVNNGHIYQFEYETESAIINGIISTFAIIE